MRSLQCIGSIQPKKHGLLITLGYKFIHNVLNRWCLQTFTQSSCFQKAEGCSRTSGQPFVGNVWTKASTECCVSWRILTLFAWVLLKVVKLLVWKITRTLNVAAKNERNACSGFDIDRMVFLFWSDDRRLGVFIGEQERELDEEYNAFKTVHFTMHRKPCQEHNS